MSVQTSEPIAVIASAAIMPQAPTGAAFWDNIRGGVYSITETPADRWDPALYYDADHGARDKTYSKIGGWVRDFEWNPVAWRLPIPPTVAAQMDDGQRWAISAARAALVEAGWPGWSVDAERVAVILGNAIGGEKHYVSASRIRLPDVLVHLRGAPSVQALGPDVAARIEAELREGYLASSREITEDTMPGELSNILAGRIANLFNFRGPNYTTDAACASGLAALSSSINALRAGDVDVAITGGIDHNMGIEGFVKFCKIGALSATGTRPFDAGADGFVMGEGCALFVLKRLSDAERDGDAIQAVILGVGGSSDGKGKGITAPNPVGQQHAVRRAWAQAGLDPALCSALEAHGTSTRVGDAAELASLTEIFGAAGAKQGSIALGSVKSNIGHLKAAAGAAGLFKMVKMVQHGQLVPSLNFRNPNENVDWGAIPFAVNTTLRPWDAGSCPDGVRRGGVSAFGFGGTNFHVVVEEHVPGRYAAPTTYAASAGASPQAQAPEAAPAAGEAAARKAPLRGALVLGGADDAEVVRRLQEVADAARGGTAPAPGAPDPALAGAAVRVAIDYGDAGELAGKADKMLKAFASGNPAAFRMLRQQGCFVGRGPAPKVAFLYTGQGSQYVNMLDRLRHLERIVADRFEAADKVMTPLLGRPLTSFIFTDAHDEAKVKEVNQHLMQTEITQPAVLATDLALTEMLASYDVKPDMVMGHSLGEYGALVAAGSLDFDAALEAVSARGAEMKKVSMGDNGAMAAVFGPLQQIEETVAAADGYVVVANINSGTQAVVGGATQAVERIVETFVAKGINAVRIPVSHAFHTSIVAPASAPFVNALRRLDLRPPRLPIVANVTGEFYPADATGETMLDFAGRQIASPVQFVKGLETLYDAGARVFVEVGPKKALHGFVEDVLGGRDDVLALYTNHPKVADEVAFNQALCGLYAAGVGLAPAPAAHAPAVPAPAQGAAPPAAASVAAPVSAVPAVPARGEAMSAHDVQVTPETIRRLGEMFAGVLAQGLEVFRADPALAGASGAPAPATAPSGQAHPARAADPLVITGASVGLPGSGPVFDDENVARLLAGQQFISSVPQAYRDMMVDLRITRVVKDASGGGSFATIDDAKDVIKLAGRLGDVDIVEQFGVERARDEAYDVATRLAIAVGFDALRDAGIPMVMRYKTTTLGTQLPDRWLLPEQLRDDTGIIFASAFPGYARFAEALEGYFVDRGRRENLAALAALKARLEPGDAAHAEVDALIGELEAARAEADYHFDRRFLLRVLAMGHSQFADLIGCRGPNTQVNAACASTTQALSIAEDWIRAGRCRRVIVLSADAATNETLLPWLTGGFIATGAAATDERVEDAATPFDARRHGMIVGAGAAALVVESADAARERGIQPICEVLGTVIANSAFHATRLDVEHISGVMGALVSEVEARGYSRADIAARTMFVSHETYTPARGGSAAAEVRALRDTFGAGADRIVVTNTKGFTGHPMGAGIEDALAVKALETGIVPPVPNYKVPDPELGSLNLSKGGSYPVDFALRLAAGFGSQIAMAMLRHVPMPDGRRRAPSELGYAYRIVDPQAWQRWLDELSGTPGSTLEVDHRRLRIADRGAPVSPRAWRTSVPIPYVGELGTCASSAAAAAGSGAAPLSAPPAAQAQPAPQPQPAPQAQPAAAPVSTQPPAPGGPAAPAPAPAEAPPPAGAGDEVLGTVTALVAEMTGYPPELLDPELDLEADLGVDTVKQAEVFAAVRGHWQLARDENLRLRDFPTLHHVAGWVRDRLGLSAPVGAASAAAGAPMVMVAPDAPSSTGPVGAGGVDDVLATVTGIVAEMTGYPVELLDPELDLEADLGVDTVKQAEVFAAVRGQWDLERDENLKLRDFPTLHHVAGWVRDRLGLAAPASGPSSAAAPPAAAAETAAGAAPKGPGGAADEVVSVVTGIVAEMTGYPVELLDPELDLEADLGVDTVKQAEVFAAVRGHWQLERDENLKLRDFPTLNDVAGWVRGRLGTSPAGAGLEGCDNSVLAAASTSQPLVDPGGAVVDAGAGAPGSDDVLAKVTAIVAEMTGYPVELLDPDLDLEADLGVDTVKQAEVFAAVRGQWDLERDENLKLRDFPTMNHVAGWVRARLGSAPAASGGAPSQAAARSDGEAPAAPSAPSLVRGDLDAVDALPRRVPVPSLRADLTRCADTGVTLQGGRVVVMHDEGGVGAALATRLTKAGATVLALDPGVSQEDLDAALSGWLEEGPITGVYWLAGLDKEEELASYDAQAWAEASRRRVKSLYRTMRAVGESSPFLVSATYLGGYHGYDADGATGVLGGAVTGFTKSYKKERPEALVKAVDLPASRRTAAVADVLLAETLRDPGCVEVGVVQGRRFGVAFAERPFPARGVEDEQAGGLHLGPETVFVVTGAAGSIVSAITADLAAASKGVFHLLDLTPEPSADDEDIAAFRGDVAALKAALAQRISARGDKPTPVLIEKELAGIERRSAALDAVQAVQAAGGTVHYTSVDLTDDGAVAEAIEAVRRTSGRIDVLLHAAGIEISRPLPKKEPREYDLVFDVKAGGWHALWRAVGDMEVGAVVAFSSVAGRFGNQGQTDYSAANDLLCKAVSHLRRVRPQTRGLALDWTAWGGIGMATRGSIPAIMAAAGVQMLPPEAGVAWIRRELTASAYSGEVIVAGTLGMMAAEYDDAGGLAPGQPQAEEAGRRGPLVGQVRASVHAGWTTTVRLDPAEQAFLHDHRIDGTPVLPGVMGMEAFAELAQAVAPEGYRVGAIEDVDFAAPVKFFRDEPRDLTVSAVVEPDPDGGEDLLARCVLTAERVLPGSEAPTVTTHFRGTARLTTATPAASTYDVELAPAERRLSAEQVYEFYFHGPAYQVIDEAWRNGEGATARLVEPLPVDRSPQDAPLVTAPRLVELCFQAAGLWEAGRQGRLALPAHVGRAELLVDPGSLPSGGLVAHAVRGEDGAVSARVVDGEGRVVVRLDGYTTIPLPTSLPPQVEGALRATYGD